MQYLPSLPSPSLSPQALALYHLLDIGSRSLCEGIDERYTAEYFDVISRDLALSYLAMQRKVRLQSKNRWVEEVGASVHYWLVSKIWFITPLFHSDDISHHSIAYAETAETEEMRLEIGLICVAGWRGMFIRF